MSHWEIDKLNLLFDKLDLIDDRIKLVDRRMGELIDLLKEYFTKKIEKGGSENYLRPLDTGHPYGYCPICGAPGVMRQRRPNGDDKCKRGHVYPSRDALYYFRTEGASTDDPVPETQEEVE